jgi:hypothetical protein
MDCSYWVYGVQCYTRRVIPNMQWIGQTMGNVYYVTTYRESKVGTKHVLNCEWIIYCSSKGLAWFHHKGYSS